MDLSSFSGFILSSICNAKQSTALRAIVKPRYEDYDIVYHHGNRFAYFGNGFDIADTDGVSTAINFDTL